METKIKEYDMLLERQGKSLLELEAKDILPVVVYAGREDDYENTSIEVRSEEDRSLSLFKIDYYEDPDTREEYVYIVTGVKSFEIPAVKNEELNIREVNNRLNQIKKEYGDMNVFIDNGYLRDHTIKNEIPEAANEETMTTVFDSEPVMSLNKNHDRTKLEETETPVNIRDIAKRLEDKGYVLRIKPGGHLLVQDQNLSPQNSITITRKNAYIEDANLQSRSAIALYNEMKANVLDAIDESFVEMKEKIDAEKSFAKIADISILSATQDLLRTHQETSQTDFKDVFNSSKAQYQFYDEKGNEYLSLSLDYSVKPDKEKTVFPVINIRYGKEYGDIEIAFEITKEDLEALKGDSFHKTELAHKVNNITRLGGRDRESQFAGMKSWKVKSLLDKNISKQFDFLNKDKIDYFSDVALEYYSHKRDVSLAEFEMDKLKEAPFYRSGMSSEKITDALTQSFNEIEAKVNITNFDNFTRNTIEHQKFICKKLEDGELAFDTNAKEPINYDREWINKLARLEDSILDLRYGPIQDAIDIARSIGRGTKELVEGVAEFKKDGIYTGFDIGGGIASFREGWAYGEMVSALEKEYRKLAHSEIEADKIAAIDKKMDIKLLRDDIRDNANVYIKAAIALKENCDKMLDAIKSLRKEKEEGILTESRLETLKKQFVQYSKQFVNAYNKVKSSVSNINSNLRTFHENTKNKGLEAISYTETRTKGILNKTKGEFNEIGLKAQILLNIKEFNKERIAEQLNDIKVERAYGSLTFEQFNKEAKTRFWTELDGAIQAGTEARHIPETERTTEDNQSIRFGEQMKYQKEQGLFVAEAIQNEIKNCLKEKASYEEAIERLAKTYNNESMTFRLRNTDSPNIKAYNELSKMEKELCKDIVGKMLHTLPDVELSLSNNRVIQENEYSISAPQINNQAVQEK